MGQTILKGVLYKEPLRQVVCHFYLTFWHLAGRGSLRHLGDVQPVPSSLSNCHGTFERCAVLNAIDGKGRKPSLQRDVSQFALRFDLADWGL